MRSIDGSRRPKKARILVGIGRKSEPATAGMTTGYSGIDDGDSGKYSGLTTGDSGNNSGLTTGDSGSYSGLTTGDPNGI